MTELSVQEFSTLVNLATKAPATIGDGYTLRVILDKCVALANANQPIGSVPPPAVNVLT